MHPSNDILIEGAIFEGPYEGRAVVRTMADWLRIFPNNRARIALCEARDGIEGASFAEAHNIRWNLRRA